jgi:hypothetical protein
MTMVFFCDELRKTGAFLTGLHGKEKAPRGWSDAKSR